MAEIILRPLTDDDINAYIDGELGPTYAARVELHLTMDQSRRQQANDYTVLNEGLRDLFDPVLHEQLPAPLKSLLRRRRTVRLVSRMAS